MTIAPPLQVQARPNPAPQAARERGVGAVLHLLATAGPEPWKVRTTTRLCQTLAWAAGAVTSPSALTPFLRHQTAFITVTMLASLFGWLPGLDIAASILAWAAERLARLPAFAVAANQTAIVPGVHSGEFPFVCGRHRDLLMARHVAVAGERGRTSAVTARSLMAAVLCQRTRGEVPLGDRGRQTQPHPRLVSLCPEDVAKRWAGGSGDRAVLRRASP